MLDVRRLRLLCDLARLGTIAAVAAAHNFTASAVSQQLSALEREAGVRLLARTGRSVTLTAAGRVLVRHGTAVLAELEQATAALAALSGGLTGPLRIGAFPTAVRALLPATLVALGRTHPGLDLMVTELDPAAVPAALRDRRIDVGLVNDYDLVPVRPDPGLDDVPLLDEPVYLATPSDAPGPAPNATRQPGTEDRARDTARPDRRRPVGENRAGCGAERPDGQRPATGNGTDPGAERPGGQRPATENGADPGAERPDGQRPATENGADPGAEERVGSATALLERLRDFPWILATPGTLCHTVTVQLCRSAGFAPRARHHADDFTTALSLVAAGQGASIVPAMAVSEGPPGGVRLDALPTRRRTRIAYRRGAAGHPAVAAFVTAIREAPGVQLPWRRAG